MDTRVREANRVMWDQSDRSKGTTFEFYAHDFGPKKYQKIINNGA